MISADARSGPPRLRRIVGNDSPVASHLAFEQTVSNFREILGTHTGAKYFPDHNSKSEDSLGHDPALTGHRETHQVADLATGNQGAGEELEVAALLKALRSSTPITIALSDDYSAVPFRVPKPIVMLSWFWLTEAWVSLTTPQLFGLTEVN